MRCAPPLSAARSGTGSAEESLDARERLPPYPAQRLSRLRRWRMETLLASGDGSAPAMEQALALFERLAAAGEATVEQGSVVRARQV